MQDSETTTTTPPTIDDATERLALADLNKAVAHVTPLTSAELLSLFEHVGEDFELPAAPMGSTWVGIVRQAIGVIARERRLLVVTQAKHREALECVSEKTQALGHAQALTVRLRELAQSLDQQLTDEREAMRRALVDALVKAVENPEAVEVNLVVNVNHASTLIIDRDDDDADEADRG